MQAQIGLMIEGQAGLNWTRWDRVLKMAEDVGFQCVFRSDHYTNAAPPDMDSLELFVSLTYAATHTRHIEFGSLVAPVTFRHPTMTLRQAAQIDDLSGGRLILGLGAGWQEREHTKFGIPFYDFKTRFEQLTDALEITRALQTATEPVSFQGRHISINEALLLPRPARRTPILIGGNGPRRTLPLAAKYADEWNGVFIDAPTYAERSTRLDELLAAEGRPANAVKRSMMMPFDWVSGDGGTERIDAYIQAGCQRFMLQIVEYDDLSEIEQWARTNLPRFSRS
ncbi:MAG: TIGR03560 family F420-dependent LLM class oxidoreductase [Gammaproteobacteria bacterium]|nr:TIGR03560 family F420-dependent LLM class oxidoreductase [Gammaproteobacteria bacterium]